MQVVATAGHVDHGKSSLIVRLTGIDPDRWAEEKRRGLTIDLGFAWTSLPSGQEVGFVDVPGHERFIRNMLAGVGPVRLVLFVVAADEGWKPQSEEHLEILDVLGVSSGVVALTKSDLVGPEELASRGEDVRARLDGTTLASVPIVPCSSVTGDGIDALLAAIDGMIADETAEEEDGRPRIHVDRSFSIKGAGTVVTGTLTGGRLAVGEEVVILPSGSRARIRSLQTHRRAVDVARPVTRVAANLAGLPQEAAERGDVLVSPGRWRPTRTVDVALRTVRSVRHPLTSRGAYKLHVGSAERDARLRILGADAIEPKGQGLARLRLSAPVVVGIGDHFVLREAGRRATVGGGIILDAHPPSRPDVRALERRLGTAPEDLQALLVGELGALRTADLLTVGGRVPEEIPGATFLEGWWVSDTLAEQLEGLLLAELEGFHRSSPLLPGLPVAELRARVLDAAGGAPEDVLALLLARMERRGTIERDGTVVRRAGHTVSLGDREPEAARLVAQIEAGQPTPPTQPELEAMGVPRDLIDACVATGRLARVSPDVILTPGFLARAEQVARGEAAGPAGLTVSRFRELLGTTRKYALPILGSFDERGITRRDGDVRRLRD